MRELVPWLLCATLACAGCGRPDEAARGRPESAAGRAITERIARPIDQAKDLERQQTQAADEARQRIDEVTQ